MNSARQICSKAGPVAGLPFLLLVGFFLQASVNLLSKENEVLTFQAIESTCIDLAHYDAKTRQLIVRYVDQDDDRFYRYTNIPAGIWKSLEELNETGGVGNYFVTTVQRHPEKYPFEKISLREFKVLPKKKKTGDSK